MLTKGSKSVTINGHPVALTDSELSTSSGDEPGTAGGLISSKFKGKLAWGSGSVDVKIEGKGVVRYLDVTLHNGNSFNTALWDVREPEPARQGALRARARFALLEKPQQVEELDTWLEFRTQEALRPSR
jgi:uncharacterized Zn-binding protein involved in type VI secretion